MLSSKNLKTSSFKAFIFGRDDSNSKSSISTCEDLDMVSVKRITQRHACFSPQPIPHTTTTTTTTHTLSHCICPLIQIEPEAKPARTSSSAKLRSSQSRHSSQATTDSAAVAASSTTSLYDILRRSSMQSEQLIRSASVNQPKSIFSTFRVGSKSKEGRVRM